MHNKKVLSKIDLGKYKKPNPYKDDIILSDEGQWKYPGSVTRIPSNEITMENVPYMVWAQPNVGPGIMMEPEEDYYFDNADYVDEYPQIAKQGGSLKKNNTSRSIKATNKLFAQNYLFKKPDKKKIFDPNSKFYQEGGEVVEMDLDDEDIELFRQGGYIVEDISVPQLTQAQNGGGKYDPLVYSKPQVSESTKPNLVSKVDKKIIDKAIKQKTAERKIVTDKIKKDPLLTKKQKTEILMSPKKQDEYAYLAYEKDLDTVKEVVPQSNSDRAWEYITNPFTAAEYAISGGGAENMPHNINEMRIAGIDPGVVQGRNLVGNALNMSTNLFDAGDKVVRNVGEGNYGDAALEALRFLPGARVSTGLGKQLGTKTGLLSNAYKINPFAFKPNPEAYYRMIGKEGYADALESGVIRPPQTTRIFDQSSQQFIDIPIAAYDDAYYNSQFPLDRKWYPNSIKRTDPKKAAIAKKAGYQGPYMAEVTGDSHLFERGENVAAYTGPNASQTVTYSKEHIPITNPNLKFYKEHWLKGYKEVPVELPGSPNAYGNVQKAGFMNPLALADRVIPRLPTPGNYFGVEGSWNNLSPLNIIPGYGKKLSNTTDKLPVGFRKFGNSLDDVISSKTLKPKSGNRMGAKQIESEGNWAEQGKVNEAYNGVFEATMNPNIEGSNIKLQNINNRNGIVGTTKEGDVAIPLTDSGLSFNRRLPFSNKYVPINKQKLLDNKFQLATQLPHVQSLIEKYGIAAGHAAVLGYISNGEKGVKENLKTINKYSVDPVINWSKKEWDSLKKAINKKEEGGLVNDYIDTKLTPEEIEWYKSQGYDIEELD